MGIHLGIRAGQGGVDVRIAFRVKAGDAVGEKERKARHADMQGPRVQFVHFGPQGGHIHIPQQGGEFVAAGAVGFAPVLEALHQQARQADDVLVPGGR